MFEAVRDIFKSKTIPIVTEVVTPVVGVTSHPGPEVRFKAWCIIVSDGRVGYIDHYKSDGLFGVRPVDLLTGRHYPNPSKHWANEYRLKIPEELALSLGEIRAAKDSELPAEYRQNNASAI